MIKIKVTFDFLFHAAGEEMPKFDEEQIIIPILDEQFGLEISHGQMPKPPYEALLSSKDYWVGRDDNFWYAPARSVIARAIGYAPPTFNELMEYKNNK